MRNLKTAITHKWRTGVPLMALLMAFTPARSEEPAGIVYRPLKFGGVQEFGSIHKGLVANLDAESFSTELNGEWIDHFGTFIEQDAVIDGHLTVQVGLGGVFEFPKPEIVEPDIYSSMYKAFFFGPSIAKAMYEFGNPEKPVFSLGGGMFPYKYNPDAADLGEYLFRSEPYPTVLMTGGLTYVNDNAAYLQGFQAVFHFGSLSVDGLLTTETSMPPLYDWSLGLVADYTIANGLVDVGAGVDFKRLIQVRPSRTQPEVPINAYFTRHDKTYYADSTFYKNQLTYADSAAKIPLKAAVDSLDHWLNPADPGYVPKSELQYYTPAGTLVMARISLDLKKLTGWNTGDAPFKIFAEGAVLGVKDYPVFYEHWWQRAPVMAGVHLPTFGILDQLTLQCEYFNSPWGNDSRNLGGSGGVNLPLPDYDHDIGNNIIVKDGLKVYKGVLNNDNIAWAVLLRRQLYSHLNLSAQFARDHMRTQGTGWFFNGRQEPNEVLYRNSSWYWMVQLGWGL